jgi:hypothetical protein
MKRGQVSVRAEVYERLRAAASKRGLSISQIVEAAVAGTPWPNTENVRARQAAGQPVSFLESIQARPPELD